MQYIESQNEPNFLKNLLVINHNRPNQRITGKVTLKH